MTAAVSSAEVFSVFGHASFARESSSRDRKSQAVGREAPVLEKVRREKLLLLCAMYNTIAAIATGAVQVHGKISLVRM